MSLIARRHTTTLHHTDVLLNSGNMHYVEAEAHRAEVAQWVSEMSEGQFRAMSYTLNYGGLVIIDSASDRPIIRIPVDDGPCILRHTRMELGGAAYGIPRHTFQVVPLQSQP